MVISVDGDVLPCCCDMNKKGVVASVKEKTLKEIWEVDLERMRQDQINGKSMIPCVNCERYNPSGSHSKSE